MKRLLILILTLTTLRCSSDGILDGCNPGEMRCSGNTAQICGQYGWEDYQVCGTQSCAADPRFCGGYNGIACCY